MINKHLVVVIPANNYKLFYNVIQAFKERGMKEVYESQKTNFSSLDKIAEYYIKLGHEALCVSTISAGGYQVNSLVFINSFKPEVLNIIDGAMFLFEENIEKLIKTKT